MNLVLKGVHDDDDDDDDSIYCSYSSQQKKTSIPTTDRGNVSGSGVFDPTSNQYCMELVNAIDPTGRYAQ